MCLQIDPDVTEEIRTELLEQGGACTVYKSLAVRVTDDELTSPMVTEFVWRPGWHEALGEPPRPPGYEGFIGEGAFHVYLEPGGPPPVVEFRALAGDFLGANKAGTHAAFRRLHLSEAAYFRAYRQVGRVPPPHYSPSGRRVLTPPEWDAVSSWVAGNVETGIFARALVDVTPQGREGSSDPVIWLRPAGSSYVPRDRRRALRAVPVDRVLATSRSHQPPEAA